MNSIIFFILIVIIKIFHILITGYVIFGPYLIKYFVPENKSNETKNLINLYYLLYFVFSISLIVHWVANNDICCLSLFENILTGKETSETFTGRIISPFYIISNKDIKFLSYSVLLVNNLYIAYRLTMV